MERKVCSKCKEEKEVCEFTKDKTKKSGYKSQCKSCINISAEDYRNNNREKLKIIRKNYNTKNSEKILLQVKKYYEINKNKIIKQKVVYKKDKRHFDSIYKLTCNIRNRIYNYLKLKKIKKINKTFEIVGGSPEFIKEYLEKQFKDGMSWDNYGVYGWHIDHKIPLSSAKTEEEVYRLCHYTNLQPLWAEDNLKKSNKLI
jgi:hypothetical protein